MGVLAWLPGLLFLYLGQVMKKLILLPGALGSSHQFIQLSLLLKPFFQILQPNYPGHAGLPPLYSKFSVNSLTDWLLSFLELEEQPVALMGYSLGGYLALNAAAIEPSKIQGVLTLATKIDWNPQQALSETQTLNTNFLSQKAPEFLQQLQQVHGSNSLESLLQLTKQLMLNLGENPVLTPERLSGIRVPVRMGVGDKDKMVGILETFSAVKSIPNAQFFVLPNTKHPFESVNPAHLEFQIRDFFK